MIWRKKTKHGKDHYGMGRIVRGAHETCVIAVRGKALPKTAVHRSLFDGAVRAHSQKPEEFYAIVEDAYPEAHKVELFARTVRPGWEQYGDELGKLC